MLSVQCMVFQSMIYVSNSLNCLEKKIHRILPPMLPIGRRHSNLKSARLLTTNRYIMSTFSLNTVQAGLETNGVKAQLQPLQMRSYPASRLT